MPRRPRNSCDPPAGAETDRHRRGPARLRRHDRVAIPGRPGADRHLPVFRPGANFTPVAIFGLRGGPSPPIGMYIGNGQLIVAIPGRPGGRAPSVPGHRLRHPNRVPILDRPEADRHDRRSTRYRHHACCDSRPARRPIATPSRICTPMSGGSCDPRPTGGRPPLRWSWSRASRRRGCDPRPTQRQTATVIQQQSHHNIGWRDPSWRMALLAKWTFDFGATVGGIGPPRAAAAVGKSRMCQSRCSSCPRRRYSNATRSVPRGYGPVGGHHRADRGRSGGLGPRDRTQDARCLRGAGYSGLDQVDCPAGERHGQWGPYVLGAVERISELWVPANNAMLEEQS